MNPSAASQCRYCGTWYVDRHACAPREAAEHAPTPECFALDPREASAPGFDVGSDADRDLDILATWLPVLLGRGLDYSARVTAPPRRDRPDWLDHRHQSLDHARRVAARLEALAATHPRAAIVLYVGSCHVHLEDRQLAEMLADRGDRRRWLVGKPGSRRVALQSAGPALFAAARHEYQHFDESCARPAAAMSLHLMATMAENLYAAWRADVAGAAAATSHAARLRKLAEQAARDGAHDRARTLRASAQKALDAFVDAP